MDKRELILNTMQQLFEEGAAGAASVSDIAKRAGIAKGGLYYYFHSKEDVLDALVERQYAHILQDCAAAVGKSNANAAGRLAILMNIYRSAYVDPSVDVYLHMPQNAAIHQKSLAKILTDLSQLVAELIEQGVAEGVFACAFPQEYAEIFLSALTFLMDPGIFVWSPEQSYQKMKALACILEKGLSASAGTFAFLYQSV